MSGALSLPKIHTIVSDLDGTLVPHTTFELDARTIAAFKAAHYAGARIIVASGRSSASMKPYVDEIGAGDPYIACNGAQVFAADGALMHEIAMSVEQLRTAVRWLRARDVYVQAYDEDGFIFDKECVYAERYTKSSGLPCRKVDDLAAFLNKPAVKLLGVDEPARVTQLLAEARVAFDGHHGLGVLGWSTSEPQFLEISHPDVSKGSALKWLADKLDFDAEGTLAFGDSINDLPMLQWAGMSVAVGNAREEVKACVSRACGSCYDCGPAVMIQQMIMEGCFS
ncbi:Cof-type HAD-IIB family hydrolase [Clostridia bacterium]|nr:Cof-type HAD-IIB family hydrolase [Clostridia bacterium]